jgi:hypothetical protein
VQLQVKNGIFRPVAFIFLGLKQKNFATGIGTFENADSLTHSKSYYLIVEDACISCTL